MKEYGLPLYDASLLTSSKLTAEYFEACMQRPPQSLEPEKHAKQVANWIIGEFSHWLAVTNAKIETIEDLERKIKPVALFDLVQLTSQGVITGVSAKAVFEEMFRTGKNATDIIQERGLSQISDAGELEAATTKVINSNTQAVSDYRAGKEAALKFLVGQVMRATKGRANPALAGKLLQKKLKES